MIFAIENGFIFTNAIKEGAMADAGKYVAKLLPGGQVEAPVGSSQVFDIDVLAEGPKGYEDHVCVMDHPDNSKHPGTWWKLAPEE